MTEAEVIELARALLEEAHRRAAERYRPRDAPWATGSRRGVL